jgi:EAL domain-containing protein (putative c-di-GMP-specific phosphodiesterase class I)
MPPLVVSVNLSARQLSRPDLAEVVEGVLERTGFEGKCLALDVTGDGVREGAGGQHRGLEPPEGDGGWASP